MNATLVEASYLLYTPNFAGSGGLAVLVIKLLP
jgi:hypothetical protein